METKHTPTMPEYRWTRELAALWQTGVCFLPMDSPLATFPVEYRRLPDGRIMAEALSFGQPRIYTWTQADFDAPRHHIDPENHPRCFPRCRACAIARAEGR